MNEYPSQQEALNRSNELNAAQFKGVHEISTHPRWSAGLLQELSALWVLPDINQK
jgi:hypothetical protein